MRGADLYTVRDTNEHKGMCSTNDWFFEIRKRLHEAGKPPSSLRDRLLRILISSSKPVSIRELRQQEGESASVMTTHRLLNDLVQLDLAVKHSGGSRSFIRKEDERERVSVLVCKQCGARIPLGESVLREWLSSLPAQRRCQPESYTALFYGRCCSCQSKESAG